MSIKVPVWVRYYLLSIRANSSRLSNIIFLRCIVTLMTRRYTFHSAQTTVLINLLESCIDDIRAWMLHDNLKLNDDKTELLIIGTPQQLDKVVITHIRVGNTNIYPVPVARNLGSWFDANISMTDHISKICSSSFYYLYNLRRIRKYLSNKSTESLVHAFISSRLDYCNSLLYGLPNCSLIKLQRVQNACAQLIFA